MTMELDFREVETNSETRERQRERERERERERVTKEANHYLTIREFPPPNTSI